MCVQSTNIQYKNNSSISFTPPLPANPQSRVFGNSLRAKQIAFSFSPNDPPLCQSRSRKVHQCMLQVEL